MRERELRLALICYGGVSLAVYMHGITKEIWHLARASRARHDGDAPSGGGEAAYRSLLDSMESAGVDMRVIVDILAGASAGGINAIFLADAISTGRSLEPLTEMWLETADVDRLVDPAVSPLSRFMKNAAAVPLAWALSGRGDDTVRLTVESGQRGEVRSKLANFLRARWFAPPFSGPGFSSLLLDAFAAMDEAPRGPPLLPSYQPLDLFVTVTDFHGHPEPLRLNSPAEVRETEHRLTFSFRDNGGAERSLADPAELVFAARATASFPGAFPPFRVDELDSVLAARGRPWPGRAAFLKRALPRQAEAGSAETTVMIDGSVLSNAPFRPAIGALQSRPSRREIDRRFVYIDPKPGGPRVRLSAGAEAEPPGFIATILGALSDIPREQPIRDNLEAIEARSTRIRRRRRIIESIRPQVESAIERAFGLTFLIGRPTGERLASWRSKAHRLAEREAGYAYAAYCQLKLANVVEHVAQLLGDLGGSDAERRRQLRRDLWSHVREAGLTQAGGGLVGFLKSFDLAFRIRRLRFLAQRLGQLAQPSAQAADKARHVLFQLIDLYRSAADPACHSGFPAAEPVSDALGRLAALLDLNRLDADSDERLAQVFAGFQRSERRTLLLTYLGYPFYDVATFPLLQGRGIDEFDPVKVDRISPDDATAIRPGGAGATLKGIQFNNFGAFFSRAYRENDYLWGRLHGADRLVDIAVSALPPGTAIPDVDGVKKRAFAAILQEERPRLAAVRPLFDELAQELGLPGWPAEG
jgi:patatin-related protein